MNILITWATWFLWKKITSVLIAQWHIITVLSRSRQKIADVFGRDIQWLVWDDIQLTDLKNIEVCINLCWAPLLHFPRTTSYQHKIYTSRVQSTKKLVALLPMWCHTLISGSAIWYYPSSLTQIYDESYTNTSPDSFLQRVCVDREEEANQAISITRRVVVLRTGLVEWEEWIRALLLRSTRWLWGIVPWDWSQWLSVITHQSWVDKVLYCIQHHEIHWPVNLVDRTLTISQYIHEIAQLLKRPVRWSIPKQLLKFILGPFGEVILSSQKIQPSKWLKNIQLY